MAGQSNEATPLRFRLEPEGALIEVRPEIAIVAGYTGRDRAAVDEHILELLELGVAPPPSVPTFYAVSPQLVTQHDTLVTTEAATSGEAEASLVVHEGEIYITVGSDHTDRAAERLDIAVSKRSCHKVMGGAAWRLDAVLNRWDTLRLRSWIGPDAAELYQDGALSSLLAPNDLLRTIPWRTEPRSYVLFCGTVPTLLGMQPSTRFKAEILDPLTERLLTVEYAIEALDLLRTPDPQPA